MEYTNSTTDKIYLFDTENALLNLTDIITDFNFTESNRTRQKPTALPNDAPLIIFLYSTIFVLSVVGNALVILTLAQNKRMRTVTNVFLLNLAISDLLLGVFCMPFTLIGSLLRNFIFGEAMCRMVNYFQGVSVSVGVWTLVSISLERYFAICRPLHSRQWQTISHAYKVIFLVWLGSLITMIPSVVLSQLIPIKIQEPDISSAVPLYENDLDDSFDELGKFKCREVWPDVESERAFNIYLDVVLLVIPLLIMIIVYSLIARKLCAGSKLKFSSDNQDLDNPERQYLDPLKPNSRNGLNLRTNFRSRMTCTGARTKTTVKGQALRSNYDKNQAAKTRVVRMLFVVVVEFFVCWTPLYVVNTWALYDPKNMYASLGYVGMAVIHLLAYVSSCCNPLTYCFMHKKYRQGFVAVIGCRRNKRWHFNGQSSERSGTMVSVFSTRAGSVRSETLDRSTAISVC